MPLEDSPNVEIFKDGLSTKIPDSGVQRRQLQVVILGLLVLVLVLGVIRVINSPLGVMIRGTGQVQGRVFNDHGQPIQAEIFVPGTQISTHSNAKGEFVLSDVPAGPVLIVAIFQGQGVEKPLQLNAGMVFDVGEIRVVATTMPPQ